MRSVIRVPVAVVIPDQTPVMVRHRIDGWVDPERVAGVYRRRGDRIRIVQRWRERVGMYAYPSGLTVDAGLSAEGRGSVLAGCMRCHATESMMFLALLLLSAGAISVPFVELLLETGPPAAEWAWAVGSASVLGAAALGYRAALRSRLRRRIPAVAAAVIADLSESGVRRPEH